VYAARRVATSASVVAFGADAAAAASSVATQYRRSIAMVGMAASTMTVVAVLLDDETCRADC
jgi:hypothetical protein